MVIGQYQFERYVLLVDARAVMANATAFTAAVWDRSDPSVGTRMWVNMGSPD
jgi:hypothetical protein